MNQYVKITSSNIGLHQPQVEPWHQRSERERLARARPGPSADALAIERSLLEQVSGKDLPAAQASPQLQAQWTAFQATRPQPSRKEIDLETQLFQQVMASGFQPEP